MGNRFWVYITLALAAQLVLPFSGLSAPLSQRIDETQRRIDRKRGREGVLTTELRGYSVRIASLRGEIRGVARRQAKVQVALDRQRAELASIRDRLERARDRLVRLRGELKIAEAALSARLVEIYKADEPDVLTVILESDGFADLLERTEFLQRVSDQDQRIVARVRDLKRQVTKQARELGVLESRAEVARDQILAKRNEIAAAKDRLVGRRDDLAGARDARAAALRRIRNSRSHLEGHLHDLEAEQAKVSAALQASSGGGGAPIRRGSGRLIWPVNGPIVSGFGMRWGRLHAGVDIAAPAGTPVRAAASGRVALASPTGGYGNYICVQHGGSLSTCYAHLSRYATSTGGGVRQGQVIGAVGCTGHCYGDHLHFETRLGGRPVDPMGYL
jgi:murein DD-endopeptidase MepM/ murein hydrolase activator NlpD